MSLVVLRNVGDEPYRLVHDQHEPGGITILPGREQIVHIHVALLYLGNPALLDKGPSKNDRLREAELTRIYTLWGFYAGLHTQECWTGVGVDTLSGEPAGPFCPKLECYDRDGKRIWMVHEDPKGIHRDEVMEAQITDVTSTKAIEERLAALEDERRELLDVVHALLAERTEGAPVDPASIEARLGAALEPDQSQAERNEQSSDVPPPPQTGPVGKDGPKTPRTGSRTAVGV